MLFVKFVPGDLRIIAENRFADSVSAAPFTALHAVSLSVSERAAGADRGRMPTGTDPFSALHTVVLFVSKSTAGAEIGRRTT